MKFDRKMTKCEKVKTVQILLLNRDELFLKDIHENNSDKL